MQEVERLLDLQPPVTLDPVAPPLPDRPYRVLVVEDTEDNYRFFQHVLSRAGYQVDLAFNGVEAVQKAEAYSYALILMDLEMPVMGGLEAARQIRAYEQENERIRVPIVAVTAHAIEEFRQRCKEAGMDDYATKPIQRTPLLERVSRWINPRPLVLMVDDAPDGREVFRRFLEKDNRVRVLTAPDGYQALQIFAQNRVDAVVVDLEMPKMDGFTLIAALREQVPKGLPIVALTGHTGLEIRRRCEEAGCAGYLVKPASRKEVLDTMYRLLFGTGSLH
jgi:CheY-like chemotaxis protein